MTKFRVYYFRVLKKVLGYLKYQKHFKCLYSKYGVLENVFQVLGT